MEQTCKYSPFTYRPSQSRIPLPNIAQWLTNSNRLLEPALMSQQLNVPPKISQIAMTARTLKTAKIDHFYDRNSLSLEISWCSLSQRECSSLAEHRMAVKTTKIELNEVEFEKGAIRELAGGNWKDLKELVLSTKGSRLAENELKELTALSSQQLRTVNLSWNGLNTKDVETLIDSDWPVTTLFLGNNQLDCESCCRLSSSNWHIEKLYLDNNRVQSAGVRFMGRAKWSHLNLLSLDNNQVGDKGCRFIVQAQWQFLERLYLKSNNIGPVGCKWLSKGQWMHIIDLSLERNQICKQGIMYLTATDWHGLVYLNLNDCFIRNEGMMTFLQLKAPRLRGLDLRKNSIGNIRAAMRQLRERHPVCDITIIDD